VTTHAAEDMRRFLDPKTLVKIQRLDLIARLVVEGFVTGMHKSPYHGFSVEFAEHREYAPGDDIKHLDWKVYGKTDRYYIKEYEEETNLAAYIVLDASESMKYKSGAASKLEYGQFIAAALAYLILNQRDSVGLATFDNEVRGFLPPSQHASHLKLLLHELSKVEPREKSGIGGIFHSLAERIRRKGLVIVISDLLDDVQDLLFGLRHLRHRKHEVILFHVMDKAELEFPFQSTMKLEGLEGLPEEVVDPIAIRKAYLGELEAFMEAIRRGCRTNRIDYVLMDTSQPLDVALSSYLATRSELKLK
jgi:uncharacterized protein (DUF58 family)